MANLLPPSAARSVLRDTQVRFAVVVAAALAGLGLVAIVAIIPSYFLVMGGDAATTTAASSSQADDDATLSRALALVEQLSPLAAATTKSSAIATAIVLRPKGVRITAITYTAGAGRSGTIQLVGFAEARQDIETYRNTLQAAGPFSSVTVPVSALVGATSGEFTITLAGDF